MDETKGSRPKLIANPQNDEFKYWPDTSAHLGHGQQSSLHTFRGFHRRGCAGSGLWEQRRTGRRHVSLSFGLMWYEFENCKFSTTTFQRAKTKGRKNTWARYCCCADTWRAFPRFQWVSPGLFYCSTAFSSAHGNNRLLQCQGEKSGKWTRQQNYLEQAEELYWIHGKFGGESGRLHRG